MAYSSANPPIKLSVSMDRSAPAIWSYISADSLAVVAGSGYITNADNLGMKVGDIVQVSESDNGYASASTRVASISSGAATLTTSGFVATTAGPGITGGTGTVIKTGVSRVGDIIETKILIDLTGLNSSAGTTDIIGVDGAGAAYLAQITTARNGTIYGGKMECLELPAGGDTDIDLYSAVEPSGVEDVDITTGAETLLLNAGASSLGSVGYLSALPAADEFLYLTGAGTTSATYTAGRLLITLYGA